VDIYRDRKKDAAVAPSAEAIARTIRIDLKADEGIAVEQRDKVINVVVNELIKAPPQS
jgi:hypothetical protein